MRRKTEFGEMSLWAFRFLLWYICIMLVQPQNRFTFLWPLRIANLSFILAVCLHIVACMETRRPLVRMGPATILAFLLLFFSMLSQQVGALQMSSGWNPFIDIIVKNSLLLIMVEAMCTSVERVWALQMTTLIGTLWWIKGGLRLAQIGAGSAGERLAGVGVSMIENPNAMAYMMCVFLPLYLYAFQQAKQKWIRLFFLACAMAAIFIVFQTGSRTGLVTLVVMGAFLLPYYGRHHLWGLLSVTVAIILIFPLTGEKNMARFRSIPESAAAFLGVNQDTAEKTLGWRPPNQDQQSANERQEKNHDTWELIKRYPVFGVGVCPNNDKFPEDLPAAWGQVHCEILMAGRQMGIIGMGLHLGFLGIIFFGGWRIRRMARNWPAVQDLGWTFQMQALAIAVGGSFSPSPWISPMMMMAGATSALVHLLNEEQAPKTEFVTGI